MVSLTAFGGFAMSTIKWVTHNAKEQPVKTETDLHRDLDTIVSSCIARLSGMRHAYPQTPPQGFVVFDTDGNEVRRWFGSARNDVPRVAARRISAGPFKTKSVRPVESSALRRILVVDDDRSVQLAIEFSLARRGHVVVTVDNGRLALAALKTSEFDLIMADLFMPEMDGIELIKIVRQRRPAIPIIAMSGYKSLNRKIPLNFLEWSIKFGATYSLHKPFSPTELTATLDACFIDENSKSV